MGNIFILDTETNEYHKVIDIWMRSLNITFKKIELYSDFFNSLFYYVDNTFLGIDVCCSEKDQKNHFNWCWNKVINNFRCENINFNDNGEHYEYFWYLFNETFYMKHNNNEPVRLKPYMDDLFDFNILKSRSELDILHDLYRALNKNLKR